MEEKIVDIICPYCGVGCNIELVVKDGKAVKTLVKGRNPEVNGKFICIKGLTVHELLNHPDKLKNLLLEMAINGKKFHGMRQFLSLQIN